MNRYEVRDDITWRDVNTAWRNYARHIGSIIQVNIINLRLQRHYSQKDKIETTKVQKTYSKAAIRPEAFLHTHAYRRERQQLRNKKFFEMTILNIVATGKATRNSIRSMWGSRKK